MANKIKVIIDGQEIELTRQSTIDYVPARDQSWQLPTPYTPNEVYSIKADLKYVNTPLVESLAERQPPIDFMQMLEDSAKLTIRRAFNQNPTVNMVVVNIPFTESQKFIGVRYLGGGKHHYIERIIYPYGPITAEMIDVAKPEIIKNAYRFWFPENYPKREDGIINGNS